MRCSDRSVIQAPQETRVYFSAQNEVSPLGQQFLLVSELVEDESSAARFHSYFPPFTTRTQAGTAADARLLAAVLFIRRLGETNQLAKLDWRAEQRVHAALTIFICSHIGAGTAAACVADCYCISFRYNGSRPVSPVCMCAHVCV